MLSGVDMVVSVGLWVHVTILSLWIVVGKVFVGGKKGKKKGKELSKKRF